jgi:hypothetical protein
LQLQQFYWQIFIIILPVRLKVLLHLYYRNITIFIFLNKKFKFYSFFLKALILLYYYNTNKEKRKGAKNEKT